ncbi:MAG: Ig-like domain-containing protein [Clostridia bacterium]|nr:Ig-like domain-containing protein [Clostridia bacterium]
MRKLLLCLIALAFNVFVGLSLCEEARETLTMGVLQPNVFAGAHLSGVSYVSSDASVARVDAESGRITALKAGTCEISALKQGKTVYTLSLTVLKAPTKLTVENRSVELMLGGTMDVQACRALEGEYDLNLEVKSAAGAVSVTKDGKLFGREVGSAMIYLRAYNGVDVNYEVKVRSQPTELTLSAGELFLGIGEETTLNWTLLPAFSYSRVFWENSNSETVEFDEKSGKIRALSNGESVLSARTENGLKASVRVSVLPEPTYFETPEPLTVVEGQSGKVSGILPEGTFARLNYKSLTPDTVSVSKDGTWTALKGGEGTISAEFKSAGLYAEQRFTVLPLPRHVSVSAPETKMYVGQTLSCSVKLSPADCCDVVTWSSSNPNSVEVDESGNLTARGFGSAVISAETINGLISSLVINVLKNPDSMSINRDYVELDAGESATLKCTFPRDTLSRVSFSSSDASVASVDADSGEVTALSPGTAVITARSANGLHAACLVTVRGAESTGRSELEALFMNCDSNDAILLRCGDEYAFIDSGNHIYGEKAAARLKELGVTHLKYYIGTHAHLDHIGGACVILDNFDVDVVIVPHQLVIYSIQSSVWTQSERESVSRADFCVLRHGQSFYLGGVSFKCIGPISVQKIDPKEDEENVNSLVLRADIGNVSMLLTGDGTIPEFAQIRERYPHELDTDIFKNTHHSGQLSEGQIRAISPKYAVFSTSSMPDEEYLKLFLSLGSEIYITLPRVHGDITMFIDGSTVSVTTQYDYGLPERITR